MINFKYFMTSLIICKMKANVNLTASSLTRTSTNYYKSDLKSFMIRKNKILKRQVCGPVVPFYKSNN